jgi:hypothetical protein
MVGGLVGCLGRDRGVAECSLRHASGVGQFRMGANP